jgi:hypothetical protein
VYARDSTNGYGKSEPNENSITVNVKVITIKNNPPAFTNEHYHFDVDETVQPGHVLGHLQTTANDLLPYFTYYIDGNSPFGVRGINKAKSNNLINGQAEIYVNNFLNSKLTNQYTLTVYVSDGCNVTTAKVTINVRNNSHLPNEIDTKVQLQSVITPAILVKNSMPTEANLTTSITFKYEPSSRSHSYALFKGIEMSSDKSKRIKFVFLTKHAHGLLFFNGPINRDSAHFLAVEIKNSSITVHFGREISVDFPSVKVSDNSWHSVQISMSNASVAQIIIDSCHSKTLSINYTMLAEAHVNDDVRLSLGGVPPKITLGMFYDHLNVFEYEGCFQNLTVDKGFRDLKLNASESNLAENAPECECTHKGKCEDLNPVPLKSNAFAWWNILIISGLLMILGKNLNTLSVNSTINYFIFI